VGLDRLTACVAATALLVAPGCGRGGHRPARLLDGRPAARFDRVDGSVIAFGRVVGLDARADRCLAAADRAHVAADTPAVERVGVNGASLTFANRDRSLVYACDGGIDLAGERPPPWCHTVVGEVQHDRVVEPRLDVLCSDRSRRPLAYAFVDPIPGARWIGVRQDGYVELYEVLGTLPVRVASTRGIDAPNARATFEITQYDASGDELVHGEMEAVVAG
jgi:hypothetical protein